MPSHLGEAFLISPHFLPMRAGIEERDEILGESSENEGAYFSYVTEFESMIQRGRSPFIRFSGFFRKNPS